MSDDDDNDRRNRSPDSRGYGDNDRREPQDRDRDRDRGDRSDPKHNDTNNNNNNNGSRSNNGRDAAGGRGGDDAVIGSTSLRPVFLGNLDLDYRSEEVVAIFEKPVEPPNASMRYSPIPVDRIDLKRGYCFVFLKDVSTQSEKEQAERFVQDINGMSVPYVSNALRVEFARGDGRVKRKEDERRRFIEPSDTLFVVNFHEQTTRRADLEMLFEPFGEITRIDMKRNYAFIQFRTIDQATRAKESTHGGKLDQSVLTVEYVARQRPPSSGDGRGGGGGGGGYRGGGGGDRGGDRMGDGRRGGYPPPGGGGYDSRRRDYDRRSPPPGGHGYRPPPPPAYGEPQGRYHSSDRPRSRSRDRGGGGRPYDDHRGPGRDDPYRDSRGRDYGPPRGRSRSPPSSRAPPPSSSRYDDRDRYGGGDSWDRDRRASSRSPPRYRDSRPSY